MKLLYMYPKSNCKEKKMETIYFPLIIINQLKRCKQENMSSVSQNIIASSNRILHAFDIFYTTQTLVTCHTNAVLPSYAWEETIIDKSWWTKAAKLLETCTGPLQTGWAPYHLSDSIFEREK